MLAPAHRASSVVIAHGQLRCAALLLWAVVSGALAQDIPSGFKVDRYIRVWERNPFTLVEPTAPENLPSPFAKFSLTSWLKDGGDEVILVQNSVTDKVEKITAIPNQNNLRLVGLHLDPNPQFVEAVISDGKEQGSVKFRFDKDAPSGPTTAASAQAVPRVPVESGPRQPPVRRKHLTPDAVPEHSNSGQN